jgi:RNA binding exosome subunit
MEIVRAEIQTFVHATEDLEKVLSCLRNILPEFKYHIERAYGHFKNPIDVISITWEGREAAKAFEALAGGMSREDRDRVLGEVEERLEDGKFYLRYDKMKACSGSIALGEGIQLTITVTSYPFNRKKIIEEIRQAFL